MNKLILIGLGGFIGAILRYEVSGYVQNLSRSTSFPYGTLAVNALSSFVIGLLYYFIEVRGALTPEIRSLVLIGLLGAFTTFSTFSMETVNLLLNGQMKLAFANLGLNAFVCLLAAWGGRMLPAMVWR